MTFKSKFAAGIAAAALLTAGLFAQGRVRQRFERGDMRAFIVGYLDLSDTQKAEAKAIFGAARSSAQPYVAQLKQGHQSMQNAVKSGAPDAQLEQLAADQGALVGKVAAVYAKAFRDFYPKLTPEQKDKAEQLRERVRQRIEQRISAASPGF